jgi:uncharacterized protein DUF5317
MLLVIVAIACLVSVPLLGGRLMRLSSLEIRAVWAALAAAGLQVWITQAPEGHHALHVAMHLASYGLVALFLVANRRLPGMPVLALGAALNMLAIASNGGVMPASASALRTAGIEVSDGFANSAAVAHPHLQWFGDVIPVPGPWPIGNVLSVGDLLIFAGALYLLHRVCGSRLLLGRRPARAHS